MDRKTLQGLAGKRAWANGRQCQILGRKKERVVVLLLPDRIKLTVETHNLGT